MQVRYQTALRPDDLTIALAERHRDLKGYDFGR
jgi:hypothetical protein